MATVNLNSIKEWFKTAKKPTQQQFWDTWDSFYHKLEKIPITTIEGLQNIINNKLDTNQFDTHTIQSKQLHEKTNNAISNLKNDLNNSVNKHKKIVENLQQQIDTLDNLPAIRGCVYNHATLMALDTHNLITNDTYIVLNDETNENKATLYNWHRKQWNISGEFYTDILNKINKLENNLEAQIENLQQQIKIKVIDEKEYTTDGGHHKLHLSFTLLNNGLCYLEASSTRTKNEYAGGVVYLSDYGLEKFTPMKDLYIHATNEGENFYLSINTDGEMEIEHIPNPTTQTTTFSLRANPILFIVAQ